MHWCNDVFARVFPAADDVRSSAVRHLASVAARAEPERRAAPVSRGRRLRTAQAEAEHAADLIAELKRTRPAESIAVLAERAAASARDSRSAGSTRRCRSSA